MKHNSNLKVVAVLVGVLGVVGIIGYVVLNTVESLKGVCYKVIPFDKK